jgi:hypothetical protein
VKTCCPYDICPATPAELFRAQVCLHEVFKDAKGQLSQPEGEHHVSPEDDCRTLTTDQDLYSSSDGALGGVRGTLEGLVVRSCEPRAFAHVVARLPRLAP